MVEARPRHLLGGAALLLSAALHVGCSVRQLAIRQVGAALAGSGGGAFAAEDDPQLAAQAIPFSLKLIESLLLEVPDDRNLLLAAAGGFTQYAYAFVQEPADRIEEEELDRALAERVRARRLHLRAHRYALRGLETRHPGLAAALAGGRAEALARTDAADVPLLYWAAGSLGAAISVGKEEPALVARQMEVQVLLDRAVALDPDWGEGSLQDILIAYEPARIGGVGDPAVRARAAYDRSLAASRGRRAGTHVALAESVALQQQDRESFVRLLEQALALDPEADPRNRLPNVLAQSRARWLLSRVDDLFLPPP